jgi:DNA-binding NarL/FixJ family response regulator
VLLAKPENNLNFDTLCRNFDISPREKEIVQEICKGLTNQQIADKLFISLQTVKDHTHRIYIKVNCASRAQLITIVNDKAVLRDE